MAKARLDDLLVQKGFAQDRKEALALVLSGRILIGEQRAEAAGSLVDNEAEIRIKGGRQEYVSRGGLKLEAALREFHVPVTGKVCADLGASTGGFTDCLLKHGAARVHAFDVGKGLLDWRLRQDPRVVVHDEFNVRRLTPGDVGEPVDLITLDLSFISLTKVLPALRAFAPVLMIALVKPQFEATREEVGAGGIIRQPELQAEIVRRVKRFAADEGFELSGETPSPIPGQKGNREFLILLRA
ncbi:MAG: TlyA family RNA methyltransferase [Acidobacteria bacterium]|nr:MAG: TlyA family RNA methyltransferase [Acidobacteriota bacterium]